MRKVWLGIIIFSAIYSLVSGKYSQFDMTFIVPAGKSECFFQHVLPNQSIEVEYQVIEGAQNDISFQLADPLGLILVGDYKKTENSHQHTAVHNGDYRFCFDNTFSTYSQKTVFFDILIDSGNESDDYEEEERDKEIEFGDTSESYLMQVSEISQSITRVKDHVSTARRIQEILSAHEARDRNYAEDVNYRVFLKSLTHIFLMIISAVCQVMFVKSLFDNGTSIISKYLRSVLSN